jgi:hypothetical protein
LVEDSPYQMYMQVHQQGQLGGVILDLYTQVF